MGKFSISFLKFQQSTVPLTFTAEAANSTVKLVSTGIDLDTERSVKYSLDNGVEWQTYTNNQVITLTNIGDSVQFKNETEHWSTSDKAYIRFVFTKRLSASGNVNSLVNFSSHLSSYCFYQLFSEAANLTSAPELPAVRLAPYCYNKMFFYCDNITSAPLLPATILAEGCYKGMFQSCRNLITATELPATRLKPSCYREMFHNCLKLVTPPSQLPASVMASNCYRSMFQFCESLTEVPALNSTSLASTCYYSMFNGCKSLLHAPILPATELAEFCYGYMFNGCIAMISTSSLPATKLTTSSYKNMYSGCASLTSSPEIFAEELAEYCCQNMFNGCNNMTSIKVHNTSWGENLFKDENQQEIDCFEGWVDGISATGTFTKLNDLPVEYGSNRIPEGWNIEVIS